MIYRSLANKSNFCEIEALLKVALSPASTSNPLQHVRKILNELLFKYDEILRGVPICYSEPHPPENKMHGRLYAEQPWVV